MRYSGKRFFSLLTVVVLILLSAFYGYKKVIQMNYLIKPAMLPQNELWTVEYSWLMVRRAITPEIPQIDDEEALLELIRHAWLWDKNAMIQYARIQVELRDDAILDDFIRKHAHRIADQDGQRLKRPDIFDRNYSELITELADMQYPLAADLVTGRLLWSAGKTGLIHNPLTPENRAQLIHYTRYAIQGGYHIHSELADAILFDTGFAYKDSNEEQINTLPDRIRSLPRSELEESFSAYKTSALHGSQYAQIRMSEFYLYGVGVEQSLETACAWSLVARDNFIAFSKDGYHYFQEKDRKIMLDKYNNTVLSPLMRQHMTKAQIERSAILASQIKSGISETDYYLWASRMDAVPPAP